MIDIIKIINRVKKIIGSKKDKEIADIIGISSQDFSARKKRKSDTLINLFVDWGVKNGINLNRVHKQNILNLESDLSRKKLDLENAEKGIQKIDYSKTNWRMIKKWNDDHEKEIKVCKSEICKVEAAIAAEKRNYIAERIIIGATFKIPY